MNEDTRAFYLDFVNRSFRDIADRDYLAARTLYRQGLGLQFLWAAQQAIEKYLKGILLYNDISTKKLSHDLEKALGKVRSIKDIQFDLPRDVEEFVTYVNDQGNNRYFEKIAYATGRELLMLDKAIWHIRRYCYYMRGQSTPGPDGRRIDLFSSEIAQMKAFPLEKANKFRIPGGYLEDVLKDEKSALRRYLVWKNFYYGSYKKKTIKNFRAHSWSANPAHYLNPDVFMVLRSRVRFSPDVMNLFANPGGVTGHAAPI